jgi:paraquat-inducible protein B
VLFRGVRVGFVKDIQLIGDVGTLQPAVRTTLELTPDAWILYKDGERLNNVAEATFSNDELVKTGLRARLGSESLVTGQLVVELDFVPDTEPVMRAFKDENLREIPTIPTDVQQFLAQLQDFAEKIDFDALASDVQGMLKGLNELANSEDARDALAGLNRFASDDEFQQLPARLQAALVEVRSAAGNFAQLSASIDTEISPLISNINTTLSKLDGTLDAAQSTLDSLDHQLNGDTGLESDVSSTLREVRDTARSLRVLTDYLQNNPESLIRGKQ